MDVGRMIYCPLQVIFKFLYRDKFQRLDGVDGFSPNPDTMDRDELLLWLRPKVGQYCHF